MTNQLAAGLVISAALCVSAPVSANTADASTPNATLFPAHDYSTFSLPAIGETASQVNRLYGEPASRQQGSNGVDMWDYGSFRVIFTDNEVSYAAMW